MKIEIKIIEIENVQLRHIINIKDTDMVYLGTLGTVYDQFNNVPDRIKQIHFDKNEKYESRN